MRGSKMRDMVYVRREYKVSSTGFFPGKNPFAWKEPPIVLGFIVVSK